MGKLVLRAALVLALAAGLSACERPAQRRAGTTTGAVAGALHAAAAPHADLACRACHNGPQADRGEAEVPSSSCEASGCHEDGGPTEVQAGTVHFRHRDHGVGGEVHGSCSGCHTHDAGGEPLRVSVDACALCHLKQVSSRAPEDCRFCHENPDHSRLTSQGVVVPHSELPWMEIGCVRCHYDVSEVKTTVSSARCRQCHADLAQLNQEAVGRDLHPLHNGITCTACHERHMHRVVAMSSAVDLVCSNCHPSDHGLKLKPDEFPESRLCNQCHTGVHAVQQQLVLGISPEKNVLPSYKFLVGVTCRSCHLGTAGDTVGPLRGTARACTQCHDPLYAKVLGWWMEGIQFRLRLTRSYLGQADRELKDSPDTAQALLRSARSMVDLVARGGGEHNLDLSDRLMRDAVSRAGDAYAVAGRTAPAPPNLGPVPHPGLCSYCHYDTSKPLDIRRMPEALHRRLFRARR